MPTPFPVRANGSILQYPNGEDDIVQSNVKWLDCGEGAFNSISTYVAGGSPVVFAQKRFRVQYSSLSDADAVTIENFYTSMGGRLGSFSMIDDAGNTWLDCHFDVDQLDITYEQLNVRSMSFEILAVNPVTLNSMDPTVYLARQFYAPNDGIDFGPGSTSDSSLLLSWRLDEGTGSTAIDKSGNGDNGTWSGTPIGDSGYYKSESGLLPYAGAFDGSTDSITNGTLINTPLVTVSAWIYLTSYPSANSRVVGFKQGSSYDKELVVNSTGTVTFYAYDGGVKIATSTSTMPLNSWVHLAGTVDGTDIQIFINGSLVGTALCGASYTGYSGPNVQAGGSDVGYAAMAMVLSTVSIYSRALSSAEIAFLYAQMFVVPTASPFNVIGDLSIGMWVYLIPSSTGTLISYGSDGGTFPAAELAFCLSIAGGPTTFSVKYSHDYSGGRESHTFTANIPVNTWTYVGITRNASAKTVALTTNVGGTMTLNQTITYTNAPGTSAPAVVSHLTVGTLATSSRGYIPIDPSLFPTVALIETAYIWNVQETLANHVSAAALTPSTTGLILNLATMGQSPEPSVIGITTTLGFVTGTRRVPGR